MRKTLSLFTILGLLLAPITTLSQSPSDEASFFIEPSFHAEGKSELTATLENISDEAYFYVDKDFISSLVATDRIDLIKKLILLGDEFDSNIYHNVRALYGSEHNPEPKVTVLVAELSPNTPAFVNSGDILSASENPSSNERAIIYMDVSTAFREEAKHHLAHEFAHIVELNQKERKRGVVEEKWLSEALAEYAPTLAGYRDNYLQSRVEDFIANPSTPLTAWSGLPADMSASALFAHYLADHYGEEFLRELMRSEFVGRQNITQTLQRRGHAETFADVYARWTVANYINTPAIGEAGQTDERYSYKNPDLSIANLRAPSSAEISVFPGSETGISLMLSAGGSQWVRFVPGSLNGGSGGELDIKYSPSDSFEGNMPLTYVTMDISGEVRVHRVPRSGATEFAISDFGSDVLSVVVVTSNMRSSDIEDLPEGAVYSLSLIMKDTDAPCPECDEDARGDTDFADGALLRAHGDPKVYVIKEGTKRWIPSSSVFNGYGHLRWQDIIDVPSQVLAQYEESRLIRFAGDPRVFEVNSMGRAKQWLNITPAQFDASARSWRAIYEVNRNEFEWYTTGTPLGS